VEYAYGLPVKPAVVAVDADDDELSAAATKLQAARRGQQDRRQVRQQAAVQATGRGQRDRREMREQAAAATPISAHCCAAKLLPNMGLSGSYQWMN
jgi:hypothetical protein